MNVGISTCRLRRRELNVEILVGEVHKREKRIGALDYGARDAGRGASGGGHGQERWTAGEAVDFIAVDEEGVQEAGLSLAGGSVQAGEDMGRDLRH